MAHRGIMTALVISAQAWTAGSAQDIDARTKQVGLENSEITLEKARLSGLDTLRSTSGGSSTFTNAEKSAEGIKLRNAIYANLADRLVAILNQPGFAPATGTADAPAPMPFVVLGVTPPSVASWLSFDYQSKHLKSDLDAAVQQWDDAPKASCKAAPPGAAAASSAMIGVVLPVIAASVISAASTTYSFTGGTITATPTDAETAIGKALRNKNYRIDLESYGIDRSGEKDAETLLSDVRASYDKAKGRYDKDYMRCLAQAGGKPEKIENAEKAAAGSALKTLTDNYLVLEKALFVETNGVIAASTLVRQKALADNKTDRPIVYLTAHEAALTAITKKNLLTGWAIKGTKLTAYGTMTYVIVRPDGSAVRDQVSCQITNKTLTDIDDGKGLTCS